MSNPIMQMQMNTQKPNNMTMHELCELEKISDIMKDMAEYWSIKSDMARMMGER